MTFEPISDDFDDTAPTRRRRIAGRRTVRRHAAIIGTIAEHRDASARTIANALKLNITTTVCDLQLLENQGRIISERVMPLTPTAPSWIYRLPTDDERAQRMLAIAVMEERLRQGLRAVTDHIRPEEP